MIRRAATRRLVIVLAVVLAAGLTGAVLVVVGGDDADATIGPSGPRRGGVGPERHIGPQGRVGQFVVTCRYSHSAPDDPIVLPGRPGLSHRHDFYGATGTDASSRPADLVDGPTTCDKQFDTAAYWQPTLYDHDTAVVPREVVAYYRAAPHVVPAEVRPFPFGLALIAGDHTATRPRPGGAAGWTCGSASWLEAAPPDCPGRAPLHLVLTFQDCWDGRHLDSVDHRSHVAYSVHGRCPPSHPVHVPQLTMSVTYPVSGPGHALRLASGNASSAHGDFLNAWEPEGLAREVDHCIRREVVCDLASNREDDPLFQHR